MTRGKGHSAASVEPVSLVLRSGDRGTTSCSWLLLASYPRLPSGRSSKCRWQVQRFFKWIKQRLRIKRFCGNAGNSVSQQVKMVISVYVLVSVINNDHGLGGPLQ